MHMHGYTPAPTTTPTPDMYVYAHDMTRASHHRSITSQEHQQGHALFVDTQLSVALAVPKGARRIVVRRRVVRRYLSVHLYRGYMSSMHIYMYANVCMYVCMHVCLYAYMHIHKHPQMLTYTQSVLTLR